MLHDKLLAKMESHYAYIFTKKKKSKFLYERLLIIVPYSNESNTFFQMYNKKTRA